MRFHRFIRQITKSNGFSLIEVVVAVAILGIVALAGATLATVANKSTEYADRKQELLAFSSFLIQNLKNTSTCTQALNGNYMSGSTNNGHGSGHAYGQLYRGQPRSLYINDIQGLQMDVNMTGVSYDPAWPAARRQILPRRLQIDDIILKNGVLLSSDPVANTKTYLANIFIQAEEINGMTFAPLLAGAITITADSTTANEALVSCEAVPATAIAAACQTGLGCTYSGGTCSCTRTQMVCLDAGTYPTKMDANGLVKCEALGSDPSTTNPLVPAQQCGPNEYLVGVSLSEIKCAPAPTCPSPTTLSGFGNPIPGLIKCKCPNAGDSWNGTGCAPAAQCGPANGVTSSSAPTSGLCTVGTPSSVSGGSGSNWTWTCTSTYAGVACSAPYSAPGCPAQTLTWTDSSSGLTCSGSAPATAASSSATVSAGSGATGSATFACSPTGSWGGANAGATCTICATSTNTTLTSIQYCGYTPDGNICKTSTVPDQGPHPPPTVPGFGVPNYTLNMQLTYNVGGATVVCGTSPLINTPGSMNFDIGCGSGLTVHVDYFNTGTYQLSNTWVPSGGNYALTPAYGSCSAPPPPPPPPPSPCASGWVVQTNYGVQPSNPSLGSGIPQLEAAWTAWRTGQGSMAIGMGNRYSTTYAQQPDGSMVAVYSDQPLGNNTGTFTPAPPASIDTPCTTARAGYWGLHNVLSYTTGSPSAYELSYKCTCP